jgi:cytosine/uracil/thiamine/allantoin permease
MFILAGWMLYQADFSVIVCPWVFVSSPSAITLFVSIFGSVLGPMFGIMVCDYCLAKRETVVVDDLYTMAANGTWPGPMVSCSTLPTPALGALDVTVSSICRSVYNV